MKVNGTVEAQIHSPYSGLRDAPDALRLCEKAVGAGCVEPEWTLRITHGSLVPAKDRESIPRTRSHYTD